MKKNNTDKIMDEYQKELKKLFEGKGTKSFDKMTGEALDKLKEEVKKVAEATKKESKKKTITCPVCGKSLKPNRYGASITIKTIHFPLYIERDVYYCRDCKTSIDPVQEIFNLYEGHKITSELVEEIAYSAQKNMSFKEAQESIIRYFDLDISESLITEIAESIGDKVYKNDIEKAEIVHENFEQLIPDIREKDKEKCNLNIMADGSMVSIKTQEGLCWKEMKLGMVYKDNNKIKMTNGKNIITEKDYVAYLGSPDEFRQLLLNSAIENGYGTTENTVFIADGAKWLWNICEDLFPDAIQILDYYHLSENVYKYANFLYPDEEKEMVKWAETVLKNIKDGRINDVIERLPDINYNNKDSKQNIPNLKGYLLNNRNRVNYKEFKKRGFCIGSGAIESGNKKVIQQRLKQSGMHWSPDGGQNIASLRVKYCSKKWDEVENIIYNAA